jgi:hypothetical protein
MTAAFLYPHRVCYDEMISTDRGAKAEKGTT